VNVVIEFLDGSDFLSKLVGRSTLFVEALQVCLGGSRDIDTCSYLSEKNKMIIRIC